LSFSASPLSVRTFPLSNLVTHLPQLPCRQPEEIKTPFFSELSNTVSSGDVLHVTAEGANFAV
jgi:hypothetical protein